VVDKSDEHIASLRLSDHDPSIGHRSGPFISVGSKARVRVGSRDLIKAVHNNRVCIIIMWPPRSLRSPTFAPERINRSGCGAAYGLTSVQVTSGISGTPAPPRHVRLLFPLLGKKIPFVSSFLRSPLDILRYGMTLCRAFSFRFPAF
jgi:hypothetical protein